MTAITASTLLIAFATTSYQLRTVRAVIDWGQPKTTEKMHPGALPLNPTVRTRHLAVTSWHQGPFEDALDGSQLTHLEFLPPSASGESPSRTTAPTILTMRSYLPQMSDYNQDMHTTVDKWEVRERAQTIHPAFEQLSSRRNSIGSKPGVCNWRSQRSILLTVYSPSSF